MIRLTKRAWKGSLFVGQLVRRAAQKAVRTGINALAAVHRARVAADNALTSLLSSQLGWLLVHAPLAAAGLFAIFDHERAMNALDHLLRGDLSDRYAALPGLLLGAYVALALLDHLWHCFVKLVNHTPTWLNRRAPWIGLFTLIATGGAG
jgi:hypothetical protein